MRLSLCWQRLYLEFANLSIQKLQVAETPCIQMYRLHPEQHSVTATATKGVTLNKPLHREATYIKLFYVFVARNVAPKSLYNAGFFY